MHEYNTTALIPSFFLTAYPPWVMERQEYNPEDFGQEVNYT